MPSLDAGKRNDVAKFADEAGPPGSTSDSVRAKVKRRRRRTTAPRWGPQQSWWVF